MIIHQKGKKSISIILITVLVFTGLFSFSNTSYAITTYQKVTKYHLDLGAQHIWGTGDTLETAVWQNDNAKGGDINVSVTLNFPKEVSNVKAYPLTTSNFKWNTENYSYNSTAYLTDEKTYTDNYSYHASKSIYNISAIPNGKDIDLSYTASLTSASDFDLKKRINMDGFQKIIDLLGGTDIVQAKYPDTYNRLLDGATNGIAENVYGYMYFTPVVIQYDVVEAIEIPVGDFKAGLEVPTSAKAGESFPVEDTTVFGDENEFACSALSYRVDGGSSKDVTSWGGNRLGSTMNPSFDTPCSVKYTLTVWNIYGTSKTVSKTIVITDNTEVNATALLELPEYTFEGHPALAKDVSEFEVDGVAYSARRAYEESMASNSFVAQPSGSGTASRLTDTTANMTFKNKGNYNVKLEVRTKDGKSLSDIKPIEVRKTPSIEENLGGFQKENRKQILDIAVATSPDYPLTDYYIKLKDGKTGQEITLTKANPQVNNATIKTRTITSTGNQYWTNFTLEFLTKNTETQEYRYTIYAIDSKGDTDSVQQYFTVEPDLPPVATIMAQDSYLRDEGTNVATISLEDGSTTDGDQLERTWKVDDIAVQSLAGYQDHSFGTKQEIQYQKTGVGTQEVVLTVKDVWTEPTLAEYITEGDYKEGTTTAGIQVVNIAPVVTLALEEYDTANLSILADQEIKTAVKEQMDNIRMKLIESGIDATLQFLPVDGAYEGAMNTTLHKQWNGSNTCSTCTNYKLVADSEYAYMIKPTTLTAYDGYSICSSPHVIYALAESGTATTPKTAWSYIVNQSENFVISEDRGEQYILIHCKDTGKTILLNRDNGAYLTTLEKELAESPFVSEDGQRFYYVAESGLMKYDIQNNTLATISQDAGYIPRIQSGKLTYVAKEGSSLGKFYIAQFDMTRETMECIALPTLDPIDSGIPVDMDFDGHVVFLKTYLRDNRYLTSYRYWYADTKYTMQSATGGDYSLFAPAAGLVKDEAGKGIGYYRYQVTKAQPTNSKNYTSVYFTKINEDGTVDAERRVFYGIATFNPNGKILYAKYHTSENAVYLVQNTDVNSYGYALGGSIKIPLDTYTGVAGIKPYGFDDFEEMIEAYGNLVATCYTGLGTANENRIKLVRYPISEAQSETKTLYEGSKTEDETNNYMVKVDAAAGELSGEIKALAENFSLKAIWVNLSGVAEQIAEKIKETFETEIPALHLQGDGINIGKAENTVKVPANSSFTYSYDLTTVSGAAVDLLAVEPVSSGLADGEIEYFKEVVDSVDFTSCISNFDLPYYTYASYPCSSRITAYTYGLGSISGGQRYKYTGICAGLHDEYTKEYLCGFSFSLAKAGYVEFDYYGTFGNCGKGTIDGVEFDKVSMDSNPTKHRLVYLPAGSHNVQLSTIGIGVVGITKATIGYLSDSDSALSKTSNISEHVVTGSFDGPKGSGMIREKILETDCISDIWTYATLTGSSSVSKSTNSGSVTAGEGGRGSANFKVTAPSNKMLFLNFKESIWNRDIYYSVYCSSSNAKEIGTGSYVIYPGGYFQLRASGFGSGGVFLYDISIGEITPGTSGLSSGTNFLAGGQYLTIPGTLESGQADFYEAKKEGGKLIISKASKVGQESYLKQLRLSFSTKSASEPENIYISNFKLWKKDGYGRLVQSETFFSSGASATRGWNLSSLGSGIAQIDIPPTEEQEEAAPMVYKKGQLVGYDIYYDDYEDDPSKVGYWRYTHTPMNDGANPDAATILDEDGNVVTSAGAILTAPIQRFYIDGKYTVEHWEYDNTNRTGDASGKVDYTKYDKMSNVESLTFYIEGGGTVPWITSIKTVPSTVKEGESYYLKIGVDDAEKDILRLTTEVYKDKKLVYTHKQTDITADAKGNYPEVITGYPPDAMSGTYDVVCTVRDWSGAGLGTHRFTVVSQGKITGMVSHTDQWDENRKKYNLDRFSEEINREMQLDDYMIMEIPRKRGTNIFWTGETFVLNAETEGKPDTVLVEIFEGNQSNNQVGISGKSKYSIYLKRAESLPNQSEETWEGALWDASMMNLWGRTEPEPLYFLFTATYPGGGTKTYWATVIMDSRRDYWQLHRLW